METKKIISVGILVLAIAGIGGYAYFGKDKAKTPEVAVVTPVSVAKVNGVDITKDLFDSESAINSHRVEARQNETDRSNNFRKAGRFESNG